MIQLDFKLMLTYRNKFRQTTLLGGRWKVGETGVLALLLLRVTVKYGMLVVLAAGVAGWISGEVTARALMRMALSYLLLSMVNTAG